MRILILNFEYPPLGGGGGVATKQIAQELAKKHDVHVITTRFEKQPRKEVQDGVTIHRVSVWGRTSLPTATLRSMVTFFPAAFARGWQILRKQPFDIINGQFVIPSGLPAVLLAKLFRIPFVLSFIGGDVYDPSKGVSPHRYFLLRVLIRAIAKGARVCTAISEDTKKRAMTLHGVTTPIVVTHLGIESQPKCVTVHDTQQTLLFISIGRLIPRKGYDNLLRAWRSIPKARLVILGDGPSHESLKKNIAEYNLSDRVQLLGFVSQKDKHEWLCKADAFISTAEHEGFGLVFLEAMEYGLPIIATNNGGQCDFLTDGENAILIPTNDEISIVSAVNQFIDNPALRKTMGDHNKRKVVDFYIPKTVARFETVLEQALLES